MRRRMLAMNTASAALVPASRRAIVLWTVVVIAAVAAVYGDALGAGFVGDDFMIVHRLRPLAAPSDLIALFRGEFFEYYRPLGFVSHAVDWAIRGADPRQFHLTNVLLHAASALLVLVIGVTLAPRSSAGPVAALLFALHASNHEAVVWISARFDLLATCLALAAIAWLVRAERHPTLVSSLFFFGALLSKESTVALPIVAGADAVFRRRASTAKAIGLMAPWIAALGLYGVLRRLAGGVSAIGGAGRLPKLLALAAALCVLLLLADERWVRVRDWLRDRRALAAGALAALAGVFAIAAAAGGRVGQLAADKLAVAGFASFHLLSPVIDLPGVPFYLDPDRRMYWAAGAIALAGAAVIVRALWRPLVDDERIWFLTAFLAATLLPISALTEGARYLYLPSAAFSLIVGVLIARLQGRTRRIAILLLAAVLAISVAQIVKKVQDWRWAGRMTADGARLMDASLAPACGTGDLVLLTGPVAIRGVYTHFYYETIEMVRGCTPALFQVVARVVRVDSRVRVDWDGPSRIVITVPSYRDNIVLSRDLRHFDVPLRGSAPLAIETPLGALRARSIGADEQLTLELSPGTDPQHTRFFYYSDGAIHASPAPPPISSGPRAK